MRKHFWSELTTHDFGALDPEHTIVVLPIAATEQHGPHLPVGTDAMIADGMIRLALERLPDELSALVLPMQSVGKSNEHGRSPGTLSLSAETAIRAWTEIGALGGSGLRKLVIVSSHGGNSEIMGIVARELRTRFGMLCVATSWMRFGLPEGLFSDTERVHGIHGGDIETSLMLHFRPDLVAMDRAETLASAAAAMEDEFALLRAHGPHAFAWAALDLHCDGVVGDAASATAEKGRLTAEYQVAGFLTLLQDMTRFSLDRLAAGSAPDES